MIVVRRHFSRAGRLAHRRAGTAQGAQGQEGGCYLIQPWLVIGDTIFALEVAERIWQHRPGATIDILCTAVQRQIVADHPRLLQVDAAEQLLPLPKRPRLRVLPIPVTFYDATEPMLQQRRHYADHLPAYDTIFIEDPGNFRALFGAGRSYTHNSLRPFELQAIVERCSPLPLPFLRDSPKYMRTRTLVDAYFGTRASWCGDRGEPITLFLNSQRIAEAERRAAQLKERAERPGGPLLLVNADTSSLVTRPPTDLLAAGIAAALECHPQLVVGILPGYTCPEAHTQLYQHLAPRFGQQIQRVEPEARPEHLLDTTALLDRADLFLTGDTGLMHLAATQKRGAQGEGCPAARNRTAILTLWGGTRPGYWGYPALTTIIGEGNVLQRRMYPGIRKYLWQQKKADYFGHIAPSEITAAIVANTPRANAP